MSAICHSVPSGTSCTICKEIIGLVALKCTDCSEFVHLACSGFPTYQLIRFDLTRTSYKCEGCVVVEAGQRFEAAKNTILSELAKTVGADAEFKSQENISHSPSAPPLSGFTSTSSNISQQRLSMVDHDETVDERGSSVRENKTAQKSTQVCKHYLKKKCKHGMKGEECEFLHPKLCRKYMKFGDKKRGGCKKGMGCTYHHPALCWKASNGSQCRRETCKFLHPKGIKSKNTSDAVPIRGNPAMIRTSIPDVPRRRTENSPIVVQNNSDVRAESSTLRDEYQNVENGGFLELRRQVQLVQEQLSELLRKEMQTPQPSSLGIRTCACHPRW